MKSSFRSRCSPTRSCALPLWLGTFYFSSQVKDALLLAIAEEYVEGVEILLHHEEQHHMPGTPHSWEAVDSVSASYTPDVTPLILAAHKNNYEILKILLDRGAKVPQPHNLRCRQEQKGIRQQCQCVQCAAIFSTGTACPFLPTFVVCRGRGSRDSLSMINDVPVLRAPGSIERKTSIKNFPDMIIRSFYHF